jgi:murein DD-endopeptidase MepM/ murein hydrolase activator NlpD
MIGSVLGLLGAAAAVRWGGQAIAQSPADLAGAATATAQATRLRSAGLLFPVQLGPDILVLDNFGGASFSRARHEGIDISRADYAPGQPLVACVDGELVLQSVGAANQGNAWVLVDAAGHGYRYHHLESFAPGLSVGARVTRGQVIGTMGRSGNPTTAHLHFEVHRGATYGNPVDPLPLLNLPLPGVRIA